MSVEAPDYRASTSRPNSHERVYEIQRRKRFWAVINPAGELVCVTVYKRGAKEVVRLLTQVGNCRVRFTRTPG